MFIPFETFSVTVYLQYIMLKHTIAFMYERVEVVYFQHLTLTRHLMYSLDGKSVMVMGSPATHTHEKC